jgi:predicted glycosyltransferase
LHETPSANTSEVAREWLLIADPFLPKEVIANHVAQIARMDRISVGDVTHAATQLLNAKLR